MLGHHNPGSPMCVCMCVCARARSSNQNSGSATPKDRSFRCVAVESNLEVSNWASLWTQEHLQKRLLEPLGGKTMTFSTDMTVAYLNFESERTAQRAELICRAAAAAAEKVSVRPAPYYNLKLYTEDNIFCIVYASPLLRTSVHRFLLPVYRVCCSKSHERDAGGKMFFFVDAVSEERGNTSSVNWSTVRAAKQKSK